MGSCLLAAFALLLPCLAQDDQPKLYWRAQTTQPGLSSINIPEDELPDAIRRMEQATYVDLAQRDLDRVERLNREGTMGLIGREIPSRLITDPEEKAKALAHEQYRLAQAQAVLELASDMKAKGITPPPYLKTEVIFKSPDIYIPLDDLSLAFREHLVTNTLVFSIDSSDSPTNGPIKMILQTYRQRQIEEASSLRQSHGQLAFYGKLRSIFIPFQLAFVVGNHQYYLVYVTATDGPAPCEAQTCLAGHYLLERTDNVWQAKTHPLPDPVKSGIERALPSVHFETGVHTRQYALAFDTRSGLYHAIIKRHLTTPWTRTQ